MNISPAVRGNVAVGVDGSAPGYAAVRYAALEAGRLGLPLDVVHVLPADVPVAPSHQPVLPEASLQRHGASILARALQIAEETVPGLHVEDHLCSGDRTDELLALAERASLLVLGSRSPHGLDHVWTGGTVTGVASSAACPVVVVPADWESSRVHHRIAIGTKSPGQARDLFDVAFPMAAGCGAELVVVHAWWLEGIYDEVVVDRQNAVQWERDQSRLVEEELAEYREAYPDVPVHVFVRHEDPAHALVRVSRGADRLLVQRPAAGRLVHHLGRVTRAVLRDARCPVVVLPDRRKAPATLPDEHEGVLVP